MCHKYNSVIIRYGNLSGYTLVSRPTGGVAVGYIEAQRAATARYNKKTYDRIEIVVHKGKKQAIKEFAQKQGKSTNRFINDAIEKAMAEQEDA